MTIFGTLKALFKCPVQRAQMSSTWKHILNEGLVIKSSQVKFIYKAHLKTAHADQSAVQIKSQ